MIIYLQQKHKRRSIWVHETIQVTEFAPIGCRSLFA